MCKDTAYLCAQLWRAVATSFPWAPSHCSPSSKEFILAFFFLVATSLINTILSQVFSAGVLIATYTHSYFYTL